MREMNPKKFKLPKEFWIKWKEALLSGNYTQGRGFLASYSELTEDDIDEEQTEPLIENCSFCCLGVLAISQEESLSDIFEVEYLYEKKQYNVPEELVSESTDNLSHPPLVEILSNLNDGMKKSKFIEEFKGLEYIFRIDVIQDFTEDREIQFDFKQIVEFIEDNTEFY